MDTSLTRSLLLLLCLCFLCLCLFLCLFFLDCCVVATLFQSSSLVGVGVVEAGGVEAVVVRLDFTVDKIVSSSW